MKIMKIGFGVLAFIFMACSVDDPAPRLNALHPTPVQQRSKLVIYGEHLGSFEPGHRVVIGSTCADIHAWEDHAIGITVPPGIGIGLRTLNIHWASGFNASATVMIEGDDFAPDLITDLSCSPGLVTDDKTSAPDTSGGFVDVGIDAMEEVQP